MESENNVENESLSCQKIIEINRKLRERNQAAREDEPRKNSSFKSETEIWDPGSFFKFMGTMVYLLLEMVKVHF